ncbi:hypothetical protein ACH5RR_019501 [Cinchona calisaya]|uniref:Bifunctional inhibitor/plant lipid transfer protein/seed storage helical domain-containing protein n=1 Tax=Cinchona calisaya TaxID=153742 RepID=A0ABD2ZPJ9_9GENT
MRKTSHNSNIAFLLVILASILATIPAMIGETDPAKLKFCYDAMMVPCQKPFPTGKPPSSPCCTNLHKYWKSCYCILMAAPEGRFFSTPDGDKVLKTCHMPTFSHCIQRALRD